MTIQSRANILPIALMAFAIVGFLFLVDYAVSGGKWPWSTNVAIKNDSGVDSNEDKATNAICTMDVQQCPDGSYVSRTGPKCEFAECPNKGRVDVSQWRTYSDERHHFSLKYPNEWAIIGEHIPDSLKSSQYSESLQIGIDTNGNGFLDPAQEVGMAVWITPGSWFPLESFLTLTVKRQINGSLYILQESKNQATLVAHTMISVKEQSDSNTGKIAMEFQNGSHEVDSVFIAETKGIVSTFTFIK